MPDTKVPLIVVPIIALGVLYAKLGAGGFIVLLIALAALVVLVRVLKWAFWPRGELPRNRVRFQRIRLYLYLHPGRGHATWWELHRQWGRRASYKRSAQVRSS